MKSKPTNTRDVDVLALQTTNEPAAVQRLIVDVTSVEPDDGVDFLQDMTTRRQTLGTCLPVPA